MEESIRDSIGNTVSALLRPQTPPSPSGVLRVATLNDDDEALADAARAAGLEVVYVHKSGDDYPAAGSDLSVYDRIPPFDLLCANLPEDGQREAFTLAVRFLRVRRPAAFLLLGADYAGGLTERILTQAKRLRYQTGVHVRDMETAIVGTQNDAGNAEQALWQVAENASQ